MLWDPECLRCSMARKTASNLAGTLPGASRAESGVRCALRASTVGASLREGPDPSERTRKCERKSQAVGSDQKVRTVRAPSGLSRAARALLTSLRGTRAVRSSSSLRRPSR